MTAHVELGDAVNCRQTRPGAGVAHFAHRHSHSDIALGIERTGFDSAHGSNQTARFRSVLVIHIRVRIRGHGDVVGSRSKRPNYSPDLVRRDRTQIGVDPQDKDQPWGANVTVVLTRRHR